MNSPEHLLAAADHFATAATLLQALAHNQQVPNIFYGTFDNEPEMIDVDFASVLLMIDGARKMLS